MGEPPSAGRRLSCTRTRDRWCYCQLRWAVTRPGTRQERAPLTCSTADGMPIPAHRRMPGDEKPCSRCIDPASRHNSSSWTLISRCTRWQRPFASIDMIRRTAACVRQSRLVPHAIALPTCLDQPECHALLRLVVGRSCLLQHARSINNASRPITLALAAVNVVEGTNSHTITSRRELPSRQRLAIWAASFQEQGGSTFQLPRLCTESPTC